MSKRKLNQKQQRQVTKHQAQHVAQAKQYCKQPVDELTGGDLGPQQSGLITANYGSHVTLQTLTPDNKVADTNTTYRCPLRANLGSIVTGDKVSWRQGSKQTGVVVACEQRQNQLVRPNKYGDIKPIAANIDLIVVTIAPKPYTHTGLIDRYLVAAAASGIEARLLLNKADLMVPDDALLPTKERTRLLTMLADYKNIGYATLTASCSAEESCNNQTSSSTPGIAELAHVLQGRTSVLVGQSGVGKSSLVNALLPHAPQRVHALSDYHEQGTHTTTTTALFHLPEGGILIDSPGIREFSLWHINAHKVAECFIEFQPYLGLCKFTDCTHEHEPSCALKQALLDGKITQARMNSFYSIKQSLNEYSSTLSR